MYHIVPICCALSNKTMAKSETTTSKSMMLNGSNIDGNKNNFVSSEPLSTSNNTYQSSLNEAEENQWALVPSEKEPVHTINKLSNVNGNSHLNHASQTPIPKPADIVLNDNHKQSITFEREKVTETPHNQPNNSSQVNGNSSFQDAVTSEEFIGAPVENNPLVHATENMVLPKETDLNSSKQVTFKTDSKPTSDESLVSTENSHEKIKLNEGLCSCQIFASLF